MNLDQDSHVAVTSTILVVGALANTLLALCLAHTWKFWRQVKWYVILLVIGNFLHVCLTQILYLKSLLSDYKDSAPSSTGLCRFMIFAVSLGPSLSAMAIAALSLHVLLTTMTGNQGNRLRHALVLGLFVLLSLVMPLAKMPFYERRTYGMDYDDEVAVCTLAFDRPGTHVQLQVGQGVAMAFFPLFITVCCVLTAAVLLRSASRGNEKGDEDKSDVILSGVFGAVLLVFCLPYYITAIDVSVNPPLSAKGFEVLFGLLFLMACFPIATAIVAVVFAYVHAYRSRGEFFVIPGGQSKTGNGERQKLVN